MNKTPAKRPRKRTQIAATALRAFRFDTNLFNRFETDCNRNLRNPRTVLEALMSHWLDASPTQRDTIAERYHKVERSTSKTERRP